MKLAAAVLGAGLLLTAVPAKADLYGLVVGIDAYEGTGKLRGAVNDANDIADVLTRAGATYVALLTNEDARRAKVIATWSSILARAKSGDIVVFSFAGHGAQEPDRHGVKDEPDGYDEVFLLQGFAEDDDSAFNDKLIDDELYDWAKQAEARGVNVIFVFDTCHSGIPVRSVDVRAEAGGEAYDGYRFTRYKTRPTKPEAVDDPANLAKLDFGENIIALGATDESLRVREQRIEGKARGILSWAVARALEGAADRDGDQVIASDELVGYVKRTVFDQARHRQIPQVFAPKTSVRLLAVKPDTGPAQSSSDAPSVTVFSDHQDIGETAGKGVEIASTKTSADLIYDADTGDLLNDRGDVLAFGLGLDTLKQAIGAQRLRRGISTLIAGGRSLDVRLSPGNGTHCEGREIEIAGKSAKLTHYTAFNITGEGEIQFLWPLSRYSDPVSLAPGQTWSFGTRVGPPFGSDAVVLIATDRPLEKLHAVLEYSSSVLDPVDFWRVLEASLKGTDYEIAVQDIFTRKRGQGSGQCA